MTIHTVRITV